MTYTRDELTAKLVGMVEPMPTHIPAHPDPAVSAMRLWAWDVQAQAWKPWGIKPLDNIGDTIRCAEAKYGPDCWDLFSQPSIFGGHWRRATIEHDQCNEWIEPYDDNNHALALALALASAVDGERAEVTD